MKRPPPPAWLWIAPCVLLLACALDVLLEARAPTKGEVVFLDLALVFMIAWTALAWEDGA